MKWPGDAQIAVSFTFDDGMDCHLDQAMPLLEANGFRGTFYSTPLCIKERLGEWILGMKRGHEIGNHTFNHPCSGNLRGYAESRMALEDYSLDDIKGELEVANHVMEGLTGVAPTTFAYPCGNTCVGRGRNLKSYIPLVAERFVAGRASIQMYMNDPKVCDLANLSYVLTDNFTFERAKMVLEEARKINAWVIFCGHRVAESGFQITRIDQLKPLLEWLKGRSDIYVDTVDHVARRVREC